MADKPKTYPQQIQELKEQLESALIDKEDAERHASFIPELQSEIADLKAQLAATSKEDSQYASNFKAKTVDLEQRAVSAEQGLRNLKAANDTQQQEIVSLRQQLEILGLERDKNLGKTDKINLLSEELKTSNLQVVTLRQRIRDINEEHEKESGTLNKELRYLRALTRSQNQRLDEIMEAIHDAPDVLSNLKQVAGLG